MEGEGGGRAFKGVGENVGGHRKRSQFHLRYSQTLLFSRNQKTGLFKLFQNSCEQLPQFSAGSRTTWTQISDNTESTVICVLLIDISLTKRRRMLPTMTEP